MEFLTGLCLLDSRTGEYQLDVVRFAVDFRELSLAEINDYLHKDQPYNCAGSFRSESLGITLFRRMEGDDPTALMGLPLIRLSQMLQTAGVELLRS
ncbi:MAG: Maf family protein [Thiothrix sp.]